VTAFSGILERYGDAAQIFDGEKILEGKVFIQPIISKSTDKNYKSINPLGEKDTGKYYGFSSVSLPKGGYIICDGVSYDVLKSEKLKIMGHISHWESILRKRAPEYK